MAGRKRKAGPREKNGQIKRDPAKVRSQSVMSVAVEQPHRAWLPEKDRQDQRAESTIGRLFLAGLITQPECWAGERFRGILREFHVVLASPVTVSTAALMVAQSMEEPAEADYLAAERPETEEERSERVLGTFEQVKRVLGRLEDARTITRDIDTLLMRDVVPAELAPLRRGLAALAAFWKMEEPAEAERDRPVRVKGARFGERAEWSHDELIIDIVYG